jgi:hypothetical protein
MPSISDLAVQRHEIDLVPALLPSKVVVPNNTAASKHLVAAALNGELANATMRATAVEGILWYSLVLTAQRYLEWGSGGTTVMGSWLALQRPLAGLPPLEIHSVDSSAAWIRQLRELNPLVARAEADGHLTMTSGNVPDTGQWGIPYNWTRRPREDQTTQALSIVEALNASRCCFDIILVDGRFREACAMHALRLSHERTVVLIHDYPRNKNRQYSSSISHYYHAERRDHFGMLRAKPGARAAAKAGERSFEERYQRLLLQWA